jgi:hypothetical protein
VSMAVQEERILEQVARYRMTTREILKQRFFGDDLEGLKAAIKKLTGEGRLQALPLYRTTKYYALTPSQAKFMGLPEEVAEPLGPQALPKAFGVLYFCCQRTKEYPRYVRPEFLADFPELQSLCGEKKHYLDLFLDEDAGQARLGIIHVDLGGAYERLVRTCIKIVREGLKREGLREVIDDGLLTIALVTANETKRSVLEEAAARENLPGTIVRVQVVPTLQNLIQTLKEVRQNESDSAA